MHSMISACLANSHLAFITLKTVMFHQKSAISTIFIQSMSSSLILIKPMSASIISNYLSQLLCLIIYENSSQLLLSVLNPVVLLLYEILFIPHLMSACSPFFSTKITKFITASANHMITTMS